MNYEDICQGSQALPGYVSHISPVIPGRFGYSKEKPPTLLRIDYEQHTIYPMPRIHLPDLERTISVRSGTHQLPQ